LDKGVAATHIKPVLDKLREDSDVDVKYFAVEACTALDF